ncbi:hypothetical protein TNCV_3214811 [Trichonephila clavipes]|nr:hypothetical protein TNCV_3214811 [Trichonephila clavipes]
MDAYKKTATAEKYQFLLVDCFPTTDEEQRLRQSIFPIKRTITKLSNGENAEATETRLEMDKLEDMRKLSNQDSSPESQKTQPVNWTTWKD